MVNGRISFSTSTPKTSTTTDENSNNKNEAKLVKSASQDRVADMNILRTLATYIWVKDNFEFRLRIITALAFLVGAKVTNYYYYYYFNTLQLVEALKFWFFFHCRLWIFRCLSSSSLLLIG